MAAECDPLFGLIALTFKLIDQEPAMVAAPL
jgi:hypothetical protein